MADPFVELAVALTPALSRRVASSLLIDGRLSRALEKLPGSSPAVSALRAAYDTVGAVALSSVLNGFAASAEANAASVRPVWSGPTFDGDGDHTTSALAHLIDDAKEDVFASTYSATADSVFVEALWRAIARGVQTTILVDSTVQNGRVAAMLQRKLVGARFWTYAPPEGQYGLQHSKVVIIDSRSALVTSANLSNAAAERNLEVGVILQDTNFASRLRQRFNRLRENGSVTDLAMR